MEPVLAHAAAAWDPDAWSWLAAPILLYGTVTVGLVAAGRSDDDNIVRHLFGRISDALRRATGFPGWSMAGVLSGLVVLLIVVIGFYWDVAWHIDHGRDVVLFTPAHTMIVVGLAGLVYAGGIAMLFASLDRADVGIRLGPLRIPWSAVLLFAFGAGAVAGFPLDELWHRTYGLDVTLWSPTHLQMLAGGSAGTIALLLMCAEGLPAAEPTRVGRRVVALTASTVLVGMSTFAGEFAFGVPQFQILYLPVLTAAAAAFSLVLARLALGRWGAVTVALVAVAIHVGLAAVVGGALGHTTPRFPLYLVSALVVEGAARWLGTAARLRFAVVAGVLVGTIGLVAETAWVVLSEWWYEVPTSLLPEAALLGPLAAIAAAVLGAGLGRAFRPGDAGMPLAAILLAGVALVGALAYPLPRRVGDVEAHIQLAEITEDTAEVVVELDPADAALDAAAFGVISWQGGGSQLAPLHEVDPGRYRAAEPVPIAGAWKSLVALYRDSETMAAPVYLPADPEIGASAVPAAPERRAPFVRNTELLLREAHDGPAWPAWVAFTGLGALVAGWAALMAVAARKAPRSPTPAPSPQPPPRRLGAAPTP